MKKRHCNTYNLTTKDKANRVCTGCKGVNRKLEWSNKIWGENRIESKVKNAEWRWAISQMLRLFDALKVTLTFFFSVREWLSGEMIQKKWYKVFQSALMHLKTTLTNEYKNRSKLLFESGDQCNHLEVCSLYFTHLLTL